MRIWPALAADLICILVFAIVGRTSHGESADLLGVLGTAWPFLGGYLVGLVLARGWRSPLSRPVAVAVWLSTVLVGMLLRLLSGGGVPVSFVVVTPLVLGLMVLGWRAVLSLVQRARTRPGSTTAA